MAGKSTPPTTAKSAAAAANRVFDIAKPGKLPSAAAAANATARPVIVTNRPVMRDPMVKDDTNAQPTSAPEVKDTVSVRKVIKPMSEQTPEEKAAGDKVTDEQTENKSDAGPAPVITIVDNSSTPDAAEPKLQPLKPVTPEEAIKPDSEQSTSSEKSSDTPAGTTPESAEPPADGSGTPADATKADDSKPADKPAEGMPATANDSIGDDADSDGDGNGEAGVPDAAAAAKLAAEQEAQQKQLAELNELVDKKQYFLPINSVEKRRSRISVALGMLLIILLGLALVNFMLDAGFIKIDGINPVTHVFNAP